MTLLFLSLLNFNSFDERNIYTDLLREFIKNNHEVYCISPAERRTGINTHFEEDGHLLRVKVGNTQKTNVLEKGISTLLIERQFISAIKKHFSNIKFDLVLYTTPPITIAGVVKFVKNRDNAKTYLMLKDIFPQNAVDLGMINKTGLKRWIYKYFRRKEKNLYALSDRIGCMSQANVDYILRHNQELSNKCVEICPNSISPINISLSDDKINEIRIKYDIPLNKKIFIYGGNLGKPQGISFFIECLRTQRDNHNAFFLIVGDGTEYDKLHYFVEKEKQINVKLLKSISKEDYDLLVAACDIGLIFLNYKFTIPNFPSRLLSYMQARLPVLSVTDSNTDIGSIIKEGNFGWSCKSNDVNTFAQTIDQILSTDLVEYKNKSWEYLNHFYNVETTYSRCFDYLNR